MRAKYWGQMMNIKRLKQIIKALHLDLHRTDFFTMALTAPGLWKM
jgi:predicted oxidoreductase